MSINSNGSSSQAQAQPQAQAQSQAQPQVQATSWGGGIGVMGRLPIERNPGSETLAKLQAKIKARLEAAPVNAYEITLLPIDNNNETALKFSTLVICLRSKEALKDHVAYHTLILEATSDKIAPRFEQQNNKQIEIYRTASDAYDQVLVKVVLDRVRAAFPQHKYVNADACVLPRGFNLDDEQAVHNLIVNFTYACYNELVVRVPEFQDVVIAAAGRDTQMRVTHRFEKAQAVDATGQPVRSDVVVSFTTQQFSQNQNQSVNSGDKVAGVSEVSGFVDLVYAPVVSQQYGAFMPQAQLYQNPQALIRYAARYVMTQIQTFQASTLPSQLLAIGSTLTLRDNNNWFTAFYQHGGSAKKMDLDDIGAIGYEVNVTPGTTPDGTRLPTKSADWGPQDLGMVLGLTVQPGLMISLDIPDCGPQTWTTSVFAGAAYGDQNARQAICDAANMLTSGAFGRHFNNPNNVFADAGIRIHLGTYLNPEGVRCDIRDIGYLAVLNMVGDKNIDTVKEWSNTFNVLSIPVAERLFERKRIITNLFSNAEITGYATRVTFSSEFLAALAMGLAEAGLKIAIQTPMGAGDFNNQRGEASGVGAALLANGQTPFIQQYGGSAPAAGAGNYFSARWK